MPSLTKQNLKVNGNVLPGFFGIEPLSKAVTRAGYRFFVEIGSHVVFCLSFLSVVEKFGKIYIGFILNTAFADLDSKLDHRVSFHIMQDAELLDPL
jgi:hypothetical protein